MRAGDGAALVRGHVPLLIHADVDWEARSDYDGDAEFDIWLQAIEPDGVTAEPIVPAMTHDSG